MARSGVGDLVHFVAEEVNGRRRAPLDGALNSVACWGDTTVVRDDPNRGTVTAEWTRATPETEGRHWGTVCPTDPDYRTGPLDRIESVGAIGDVRLTTPASPVPSSAGASGVNGGSR